jgi:hypothetical protein
MSDLQTAKQEIKEILEGKNPHRPTLEEARKRLIETDPGIDISEIIKALNKGNYQKAAEILLIEIASMPNAAEYFLPLLAKLI